MNFAKNFIVNAQKSASLVSRQNGVFVQSARTMFSSTKVSRGLDEMFTGYNAASTGRSWSAAELRMKSPEDLEKLHYVCLKELNMLRTYQHFIRKTPGIVMSHPERIPKVRKTMALIRHVVGERRLIFKRSINDQKFLKVQKGKTMSRKEYRIRERKREIRSKLGADPVNPLDKVRRRKTRGSTLSPRV